LRIEEDLVGFTEAEVELVLVKELFVGLEDKLLQWSLSHRQDQYTFARFNFMVTWCGDEPARKMQSGKKERMQFPKSSYAGAGRECVARAPNTPQPSSSPEALRNRNR
jgi:hypothetical protein